MARAFAEITFTPTVLNEQERMGSAPAYEDFLSEHADRRDALGAIENEFISMRDGFYQATVSQTGWPYVQFRGGPRGFVKTLNEKTLAFADFRGNRQYLSVGNLRDENRIALIMMDYPNRRRLKIWGKATLVSRKEDPDLIDQLHDSAYRALPERAIVISVAAFDWNCPQHIPQRLTLEEYESVIAPLKDELIKLREENAMLQSQISQRK